MAEPLTPFNGATLGMMTGFWLFLMLAVCVAMTSVWIGSPEGQEVLRLSIKGPGTGKDLRRSWFTCCWA